MTVMNNPYSISHQSRYAAFMRRTLHRWTTGLLLCASIPLTWAQDNTLIDVNFAGLPGNRVQLRLTMSNPPAEPRAFTIDNPARIALDFPGVSNKLKKKSHEVGIGAVRSVNTVESQGKTRVVVNLIRLVEQKVSVEGNDIVITVESPSDGATASASAASGSSSEGGTSSRAGKEHAITNVDFRRGKDAEGRITVTMADAAGVVDVRDEGGKIILNFIDTKLPKNLEQRLDVTDFATPVTTVDTMNSGPNTRMEISSQGLVEHIAYQADNLFTLEVKSITKEEATKRDKERFGYTGEKLSLNFQNIEVRAVLQLIADFTNLNMVASDTVTGNITLRLKNVPWDQALDLVLKAKGLAMRQSGNVIMVAPAEEIAAREKQELEAKKSIVELEPLRTDMIQINYAKAKDIASLLKAQNKSLLTERGNVSVDDRTNTLIVLETDSRLTEIRKLAAALDIPIRQLLIESRIVIANDDFTRDLGVRFGATQAGRQDNGVTTVSGGNGATDLIMRSATTDPLAASQADRFNVNLPVSGGGRIALGILGPDYLLDLELSAMQREGRGEVVSTPRIVTSNQRQGRIEQGVEIPFLEASSSGATTVSFKKAVLSLDVTPQITPDDRVILDLTVNKDSVGDVINVGTGSVPTINTRQITTQVLVENGETVVLGGILDESKIDGTTKVPFLGDIPILGRLFRSDSHSDEREELLIFVTPKVLKDDLSIKQ